MGTIIRLAVRLAKSKAARKAALLVKENVKVETAGRSITFEVAGRRYQAIPNTRTAPSTPGAARFTAEDMYG